MGVSTDAIFAFGFDLGEEQPEAWNEDDFEFDNMQAEELGLEHPAEAFGEATKEIYSEYWAKQRELIKSHPVDLGSVRKPVISRSIEDIAR